MLLALMVFSLPVGCPGARIPEIFGKPVAISHSDVSVDGSATSPSVSFGELSGLS